MTGLWGIHEKAPVAVKAFDSHCNCNWKADGKDVKLVNAICIGLRVPVYCKFPGSHLSCITEKLIPVSADIYDALEESVAFQTAVFRPT